MTAIFALATSDAAYVLADGAFCSRDDSRLHAIKTKIVAAAVDKSGVLAISGPGSLYARLEDRCRSFATFDDVVGGLETEVITISKAIGNIGFFSIRVVGWSKARGKAEVHKISGGSWDGAPAKIPVLIETSGLSVSAPQELPPINETLRQFHQLHRLGCAPPFSAARHALPFFVAARSLPSALNGKFVVGGHVEQAVITAAGTFRRIICEWPDRIGEPIDPCRQTLEAA